jgi:hypothetical protein
VGLPGGMIPPGSRTRHNQRWLDTHEFRDVADICGICFGLGLLQRPQPSAVTVLWRQALPTWGHIGRVGGGATW